jgi:hypothetical protein
LRPLLIFLDFLVLMLLVAQVNADLGALRHIVSKPPEVSFADFSLIKSQVCVCV